MKKLLIGFGIILGLTAVKAESVPLVPEGATALHSISSDDSEHTWSTGTKVGPHLQIYNQDNSPFVLGADDIVETKFKFNEKDQGACVFCVRGRNTGGSFGKFVLMRAGDSPYKARFDYGTTNNELDQNKINLNNTDKHTVTASKSGITVDGTTIVPTASAYTPSSNALLIFCCDNSSKNDGVAVSGNKGSITMYYFRVKDGSGNIRLNLVPMKDANGVVGMYDQVSGLFFKSGNSYTFTAGIEATDADKAEYFLPQSGGDEPEELTMLSPADGATVALLTDRQKGWIALEPEDRVKVLVSDSSAPAAYKNITSADFSNGSPVTFTWSGATGAVTLTLKKGDATVETVTTSAGSATVYNLEPGVTYTWTLTSGDVTTAAFTFTTESNPPRIIKAGTMSLLRDLCGWTGLQGCKIRANQVFRGAPPNRSESPFESRLDEQGIDFWQNRVGLKTQIDFRKDTEVAEAGENGKLSFVDNYYNYSIEYYKAYAPSEVASGTGKNFLDAVRTILTSSKRPVYFHCKWGRDRTGTMASVILGVLGVSEDDIIDDYHMSPLYNGNQPREYFNNFVSFLTSIKTTYPADTFAESVEKYFLALGITKTEIETFRTEMLDGYEPSEEPTPIDPGEDITPTGATFYEKLANDTRAVTSSDYATGGDYIYKVSDTEYIHVFKSSNTFTLNQDLGNVQLLVVGGGGSGGGKYGGGGGAGGVVYQSGRTLSAGSYTITVGAGGASVSGENSGKNGGDSTFSGSGLETVTAIGGGGGGGYKMAGLGGGSGGGASGNVGTGKDGSNNVGGAGTVGQGYAGGISSTVGNYPARGGGGGAGEPGGNADVGGRGNQPTNEGYIGGNGGNGLDYGTQMLGYAQYFGGGGGGSTTKDAADAVNYRGLGGLGGGGNGAYLRGESASTPDKPVLQATAGENGLGGGGGGGSVNWGNRETDTGAAGGKGIVIVRYTISSEEPPEEPPVNPEDVTLDIRQGHFLEDLTAFASAHPASSPIATGGDLVYAVGDYEYHIFTKGGTLTLLESQTADILLVGGGGGAGWNGGGGGGGGAFVELSNQDLAIGAYAVTVGAGGAAAYADSKAWGQTGGTSSISGITGASAPGGTGGIGWNGKNATPPATVGGEAGKAGNENGGDGGNSGNKDDKSGVDGSAGSKSMILGVEQGFAGGGGGGGHVNTQKVHAPSYGQDGGGNGAGSEGSKTLKYLATSGEDGLGGGGGGGASGTWAGEWPTDGTTENKAKLQNSGDGGDGIVIVRLSISGGDEPVEPPHEHVWGEWVTTVEPQVGVPGEKQRTCSGCDEVETEVIPALPEPVQLTLTSPITTEENPIELLTEDQQTWLYTFTKEQRYGLMANDKTLSPSSAWDTKDIVLFSNGSPLTLAWEGTAGRSCTVELTRLSDNKRIFSKTVSGYSVTVYNLEIGAGYSWSVTCEGKTASAEFHTSSTAPRLLKTGAMRCMRDLGGWTGLQGCKIRQNEIIRGGPANDPDHVSDASLRYADDQAYDFFFNELGLKTEIDLRTTSEIGDNNGKLDVQGTHGVAYKNFNIAESTFYLPSDKTAERQNFEEIFKTIFNAANRPVYFHCARGRDRTGTVAMMCEAILGVSEDDIWRDYQSSIFTPPTRSTGTVWTDMTTHYNKFNKFLEDLKSTYSADTLAESAEKYLLSLGITKDEIETFRTDMLIGYKTPEEPTEPTGATFYEKLENDTRAVDASDYATGGDYIYQVSDTEYIHVFKDSDTFTPNQNLENVQILVIGGGGAGGNNCGGGGGAGGFVYSDAVSVAANTAYAVTVGAGGRIGTASDPLGNHGLPGENSSFVGDGLSLTANGGGGGACYSGYPERMCGGDGGSGGGATGANHAVGQGTSGQGSNGGAGFDSSMAGGGGGAGAAGATPTSKDMGGAGGAGQSSEILGYAQVFAGGGGGSGFWDNQNKTGVKTIAPGGAGGGGDSAKPEAAAKAGEDGLGGGGGGACNYSAVDNVGAAGGKGIVIVRYEVRPVVEIDVPTATTGLVYTGEEQTGVAAGEGYTVENGAATAAGAYTATVKLEKWYVWKDATGDQQISWSIAKATPVFSGTLTMAGWAAGETASEPSGLSSPFGTVEYKYYADQACTEPIEKPTEVGTYYVRGEVAADTNWNAANSEAVSFEITEALEYTTYYKVGSDGSGHSSFAQSDNSTSGWSLTQGGGIDANHTVSADGDYIVPSGAQLRTLPDDDADTFAGHGLTLAGGELSLKCKTGSAGTTIAVSKTVNIADLTLTGGGKVSHSNDRAQMTLAGGTITIPTGETGAFSLSGGNIRNFIVNSAIRGAGTLELTWQGSGSAPSQQDDTMKLMGDNSGFTGTLTAVGDTSVANTKYTLVIDGKFGGTITSLPKAKTNLIKVNYGNNPGLTVATTTIPAALKTDLLFYSGSTDFTVKNLPLMTFPAGTTVNVDDFTSVKYATGEAVPTTKFTNLGTVVNMDGTITLVANAAAIQIPVGKTLEYTGTVQQGVDAGTGYTLSGTFSATELGSYTATATLNAGEVWSDGTTAPKSIDWSIIKATNSWAVEPSLSKTTWPVNKSPATLTKGAPKFGTMTATLDGEPFDLDHPTFPTVEGEYTLVISVATSDRWTALVKEITFTITEAVDSATYYLAGQDDSGASSFFSSSNPGTAGWSETEGGAAIAHEVAAGNDYVIPSGAALRTKGDDNADTFLGDSLKLAGEIWFKKSDSTGVGTAKTVTIPKLVADGGKLNNEKTNLNAFDLAGALEIPAETSLTVLNQGADNNDRKRNLKISATATGSGTLYVSLGAGASGGNLRDGTGSVLELSGDWSGFTGEVTATPGQTKLSSWTFIISGAFGGEIGAMPDRYQDPSYIFNLANNPDGIRIAGTDDALPTCLRYRTCFYGADFANGTDINLLRVPKSVRAALTSALQFKWAGSYNDAVKGMQTGSPAPTLLDVSKISFVDNRDGTETYVYNRTTFYEKLANDTRKVESSDYATGGDYIYQISDTEYIHVFKDSDTFTPNQNLENVKVLVVGGGGSGGYGSGGGGGAGGLVYRTDVSLSAGTGYAVSVGAGGAKKTSAGSGNAGAASSIGDITAAGGGGGAGKNSAGVAGGSGGGGSGDGKSGGDGTTDLGSAGGAGGVASGYAIGGGGGGAGQLGWAAGTTGPTQEDSVFNGGCGGDGLEIGSLILGWSQYFAGGGGGGTAGGVKRIGTGGLGGGGAGGYDVLNTAYQTPGEDGLGGGGGGGAVDWDYHEKYGAAGGKGIVIVRYTVPATLDKVIPIEVAREYLDLNGESMAGKSEADIRAELKKVADNGYTFAENIELGIEQVKEDEKKGNFVAKPYLYSNGAEKDKMTFAFGNIMPKVDAAKITYTIQSAASPTADDSAWTTESTDEMKTENATGTATLPTADSGASAVKYYRVRFTVEPK